MAFVSSNPSSQVNVHLYLTQATLDIIGRAGFGYEFRALANGSDSDELSESNTAVTNSIAEAPVSTVLNMYLPGAKLLVSTFHALFAVRTVYVLRSSFG
jgi:hypothetical protein